MSAPDTVSARCALAFVPRLAPQLEMQKTLVLQPEDLRKILPEILREKLRRGVEGSCSRRYGFVVAITHVYDDHTENGRICEGTGEVTFPMKYNAIVFKPFRNEVLDAVVTENVNKDGFFAKAGPLSIFISYKSMPEEFRFDNNAATPRFQLNHGDGIVEIQKDTCVRLRLLNTHIDADGMVRATLLYLSSALWHTDGSPREPCLPIPFDVQHP